MAKMLKLKVVAEGVENAEVASWLKVFGCDIVQGYFYSKPLAFAEYVRFIEHNQAKLLEKTAVNS